MVTTSTCVFYNINVIKKWKKLETSLKKFLRYRVS